MKKSVPSSFHFSFFKIKWVGGFVFPIHIGKKHEHKCYECGEVFAGEHKLKTHICRQHVENPFCT